MLEKSTKKSAPKYARYDIGGAYLGVPNMITWGVPEKSCKMQFRHVDLVSIGPLSQKLRRKSHFWPDLPIVISM